MQRIFILGNITRDVELTYAQKNNTPIAKFSVAVQRKFKREGQPDVDFFNCTSFGKTAEFINKYFFKGKKIAVVGRMESNKYEEKTYWNLIVDEVDFADSKKSTESNDSYTEVDDTEEKLPF